MNVRLHGRTRTARRTYAHDHAGHSPFAETASQFVLSFHKIIYWSYRRRMRSDIVSYPTGIYFVRAMRSLCGLYT
jgi:hypothetical protein